jgi:indole-3-glycerol phosphate synthase
MILDDIIEHKERVLPHLKEASSIHRMEALAREQGDPRGFQVALTREPQVSLIAEIKRASPSAGWIRAEVDPAALAGRYERAGACALSVLTEERFFKGSLSALQQVKEAVNIPVLCKDFIIDPYQIYEARAFGADAVLLIVAILDDRRLVDFLHLCDTLRLDALVEVHTRSEMDRALSAGAKLVGINNRDLKTFEIDLSTTAELSRRIPEGTARVSESGIRTRKDVRQVAADGVDAVLVGTVLMESDDPEEKIKEILMTP